MPAQQKTTYLWGEQDLLIVLGNRVDTRIKALFWAEFLLTTGWATIFLIKAWPLSTGWLSQAMAFGAVLMYLLAAYRFLSRMYYSEKLLLRQDTFEIINRSPFSYTCRQFKWQEMGPLHYIGLGKKTDHPLKGKCYDYFGFETQEKLLQNLHNEGNMYFNFGGFPVVFGKGIYSWDAEEIVAMMQVYTGNVLQLGPEWAGMAQEHEVS